MKTYRNIVHKHWHRICKLKTLYPPLRIYCCSFVALQIRRAELLNPIKDLCETCYEMPSGWNILKPSCLTVRQNTDGVISTSMKKCLKLHIRNAHKKTYIHIQKHFAPTLTTPSWGQCVNCLISKSPTVFILFVFFF